MITRIDMEELRTKDSDWERPGHRQRQRKSGLMRYSLCGHFAHEIWATNGKDPWKVDGLMEMARNRYEWMNVYRLTDFVWAEQVRVSKMWKSFVWTCWTRSISASKARWLVNREEWTDRPNHGHDWIKIPVGQCLLFIITFGYGRGIYGCMGILMVIISLRS